MVILFSLRVTAAPHSTHPGSGYQYTRQQPPPPYSPSYSYHSDPPQSSSPPPSGQRAGASQYSDRSNYDTQNRGNYNHTYNNSRVHNTRKTDRRQKTNAVFRVNFYGNGSSSSTSSQSNPTEVPSTPQASQTLPSVPSRPNPTPPSKKGKEKEQPRSQRYVSLLLEAGLGYPLWEPTPRTNLDGGEYLISIGDVGILSDGLPFYTLFNITQPSDSLANRDGVPEGVDPPCVMQRRWLTGIDNFHEKGWTFVRPKEAIATQDAQGSDDWRSFNFTLTDTHGALLLLPQGSRLEYLVPKAEFTSRVQRYWRQWFAWAEDQGDLGDHQALYVVTGVEKCSSWVIAVWDSEAHGSLESSRSLSLEITEDGRCIWRSYPPARCEKRSLVESTLRECVFVRGFWINRSSGPVLGGSGPPPSHPGGSGSGESGDGDEGGNGGSRNPFRSSTNSSSRSPFPGASSFSGGGRSGPSDPHSYSLEVPSDELQDQVDMLDVSLPAASFDRTDRPCQLINQFAIELISKTHPSLLESGCVAYSHDDDWISILEESDYEAFSRGTELIRRLCRRFKFVVQEGAIYTTRMSNADAGLVQQSLATVTEDVIPVLICFQESEQEVIQDGVDYSQTVDAPDTARPNKFQQPRLVLPDALDLDVGPTTVTAPSSNANTFDFNEVLDENVLRTKSVVINRAPLLSAWATVVAQRMGFRREEALSIEMNAKSKGVAIGIYQPGEVSSASASTGQPRPYVNFMGRIVYVSLSFPPSARLCSRNNSLYPTKSPLCQVSTQEGLRWRALSYSTGTPTPAEPTSASSYISRSFRQNTPYIIGCLKLLADRFTPQELSEEAWSLYVKFRPGNNEWGSRSEVRFEDILGLRGEGRGEEEDVTVGRPWDCIKYGEISTAV
ncbi:hypothetical protein V5O48_016229 [Marasmius crinis-equi]|uniref:Uncharacterized protein n=1 Tax=Marasmius crinis-equi TaxID=585013 RepID=A0ABR3ESA0_9AGAR